MLREVQELKSKLPTDSSNLLLHHGIQSIVEIGLSISPVFGPDKIKRKRYARVLVNKRKAENNQIFNKHFVSWKNKKENRVNFTIKGAKLKVMIQQQKYISSKQL